MLYACGGSSMEPKIIAARCHEIQTSLGYKVVPEFDDLVIIGMAVKVALHIRGLPLIDYEILKLVCHHFLDISPYVVERVIKLLAEIQFVTIQSEGKTIKAVLPFVPYYDDLYSGIGDYLTNEVKFSEPEQLALSIVNRLADAPENRDSLRQKIGADNNLFERNIDLGVKGRYLNIRRHRGRDIVINPTYFSENAEIFADHVAATNSSEVASLLELLKLNQGWPLSLIQEKNGIGLFTISNDQVRLLQRLAQDGMVKPPTITTPHSGENHFLFTPVPFAKNQSPMKRESHEKAMAIVAAIRQGQLLPAKYAIRNPGAVLYKLKTDLKFSRATTEFSHQYRNLVHLRIGQLIDVGYGFHEFRIIDTPDNLEALDMAYKLVTSGDVSGVEVDDDARNALQSDQKYIESLFASAKLRESETIRLDEQQEDELNTLLLKGVS